MPRKDARVASVRLVNYKKFSDCLITLEPSMTVLSGKNGSGKSSVLSAVSIVLSWIIARLRNENGVGQYIPPLHVNNRAVNGCVEAEIFGGTACIPNKAKPGLLKEFSFDIPTIREYVAQTREGLASGAVTGLPVFAFYGVKRAVIDIPLKTYRKDYTLFDAYEKCLDGAANFRSFFTWFRACEDWENQQTARTGRRTEHPGLKAFRQAMQTFMPGYRNIYIERHPLGMILEKEGQRLNAEQLSDGEKIYLALIGDLCHRLSLANPEGDPLLGTGIVLIDEIDLHLHPQWQSEIAGALTRTFPNIQFIITTHSPHVINSLPTQSLRLITDDGKVETPDYGYGMPSEVVLGDLMSLSSDVPEEINALLSEFNKAFTNGDASETRRLLLELEQKVPKHPELPRMRKRVERLSR